MALLPGSTLASYQILGPLGAGAMGEVYRAKDTRLGREVAIKVLPEHFADDAERLKRFEREATTLASLNHPNVAQIFGVDQVGDICFLVLELVPGESLEERLKRGPLPLDEALDVCKQLAEGLEAAHEAGVIHRDLKPANVRVTPEGKVKVLDFGLAKPANESGKGSSTDSVLSTEAGRLLGTPTYMAPEQARGKSIDKRVDIWAFGCVLYECLTARRAFEGETLTDVFAAVIERQPDWAKLPAPTPTRVREFLHYCLAKDPRQRLRDIGEMRILVAGHAQDQASQPEHRKRLFLPLAVTGAVLLALDLGLRRVFRAPAAEVATSSRLMSFSRQTDLPGAETNPDLSPDGNQLVYASRAGGNSDIYSLRVGGSRALNLTEGCTSDDGAPRFSRDGQWIAFRSERDGGGLFVMGATGESARRLTERGFDPCWSPDGREIACATEAADSPYNRWAISELWIVDVASGAMRRRLVGDAAQPSWSPDGRWIAYWANQGGQRDLWVVAAGEGNPVAITNDAATDWSPGWSPDGRRLYFSSDRGGSMNLWSVGIDPASGTAVDPPRPETNGVRSMAFARFSANGKRMLCLAYDRAKDILVNTLDADAGTLLPLHELRRQAFFVSSASPDGQWLIGSTLGAREDVVLLRADGGELRKLTNDAYKDRTVSSSPDGKTLLFKSTRTGRWQPWSIRFDGSGLTQIGEFDEADVGGWSPDGSRVILMASQSGSRAVVTGDPLRLNTPANTKPLILAPEVTTFWPWAGGPTQGAVTGIVAIEDGVLAQQIGVLGLESGAFEPFAVEPSGRNDNAIAGWLPDGHRVVLRTRPGIVVYDASTKASRKVADCEPTDQLVLSGDGRTLVIVREVYDGDVWLGELE